jgi:hypothetical protein
MIKRCKRGERMRENEGMGGENVRKLGMRVGENLRK